MDRLHAGRSNAASRWLVLKSFVVILGVWVGALSPCVLLNAFVPIVEASYVVVVVGSYRRLHPLGALARR